MKVIESVSGLLPPEGTKGLGAPAPKEDFGNLLSQMVNKANQLQGDADQKISGSLLGKEELHEAMLSLEKASLSLKLLVNVRNKLVSAYEELSRMPL
jgi:flagellar hook-basal body complex protein FliE